jgi:hypothetical protein
MGSKNPPRTFYLAALRSTVEQAFEATWTALQARDPFRARLFANYHSAVLLGSLCWPRKESGGERKRSSSSRAEFL